MIPDVYHGDGISDEDAFFGACDFAILKATQGTDYTDPAYQERSDAAHAHGCPHWAYAFVVSAFDGEDQAQHLIDVCNDPVGLILDCEPYDGSEVDHDTTEAAARYLVERGYKVMIYFSNGDYDQFGDIANLDGLADSCANWLARVPEDDDGGTVIEPVVCSLHQYTWQGDMPGVDGACDLSRITGQGFGLDWFRGGADPQPEPQPTPGGGNVFDADKCIDRGREMIDQGCRYSEDDRWDDDPLTRDCTSYATDCYNAAGLDIPDDAYSGNLADYLEERGFTRHDFDENLSDCDRGGCLIRSRDLHPDGDPPGHACIVSEIGQSIIECGSTPAREGDIYDDSWDWFMEPPASGDDPDPEPTPIEDGIDTRVRVSDGSDSRKWHISDGAITSVSTGKCLDVAGGVMQPHTPVRAWTPNGSAAQMWELEVIDGSPDDRFCYVHPAGHPELSLDVIGGAATAVDGTGMWIYGSNQTDAQKWSLVWGGADGVYFLVNLVSGLALAVG